MRKNTIAVNIDGVMVGGGAPIVVQSMTNTDTADIEATVNQVAQLAQAGSELVRITVDKNEAAAAVPYIRERLDKMGVSVPLVGDFHYIGHKLLSDYPDCAKALAKYRINPGNVGFKAKRDIQFSTLIELAIKYNKVIRIGVNWGSLDEELLTRLMNENMAGVSGSGAERPTATYKDETSGASGAERPTAIRERTTTNNKTNFEPHSADFVMREAIIQSALLSAKRAEEIGLGRDKIILSTKTSNVQSLIKIYQDLSKRSDYALHLGLTEAGMGSKGIVASSAALGILLQQGIGDTIRISLTPEPDGDRTLEVKVARELLQTMGFRQFVPEVAACPGCGRTTSTTFQLLAREIEDHLISSMPKWRDKYKGVENLNVAVMGCIVNGPGESKHADIGISLPGTGETPAAPVFIEGKKAATLRGVNIAEQFKQMLADYIEQRFGS